MKENGNHSYRRGILVFAGLAVLTAIEYLVGTNGGFLPVMVGLALVKVGLVIWYYMHIKSVFSPDEGGHE